MARLTADSDCVLGTAEIVSVPLVISNSGREADA
jgi:hypothetical protein